jgi:hypothetical protein
VTGADGERAAAALVFPENFDRLHAGEEFIRAKTKEAIEASDNLLRHLASNASTLMAMRITSALRVPKVYKLLVGVSRARR